MDLTQQITFCNRVSSPKRREEMRTGQRLEVGVVLPLAIILGLLTAAFDLAAPFGDDTAKVTILLLGGSGGLLGFLQPRRPWRWGLATGLWMPLAHVVFHTLGWNHAINPNT